MDSYSFQTKTYILISSQLYWQRHQLIVFRSFLSASIVIFMVTKNHDTRKLQISALITNQTESSLLFISFFFITAVLHQLMYASISGMTCVTAIFLHLMLLIIQSSQLLKKIIKYFLVLAAQPKAIKLMSLDQSHVKMCYAQD